jgi:hypothetical protein
MSSITSQPSSRVSRVWALIGVIIPNVIALVVWLVPGPSATTVFWLALSLAWAILITVCTAALADVWQQLPAGDSARVKLVGVALAALVFAAVPTIFVVTRWGTPASAPSQSLSDYPFSAQLESAAWRALSERKYDESLATTDLLLRTYLAEGNQRQQGMAASQAPAPPVGRVTKDQETEIYSRGALNSVATAYIIRGQVFEAQERWDVAKQAYREAQKFTYARAIDPFTGEFWSPAARATEYLGRLPFQDQFRYRENRSALERYLTGLLTDHPHKNCDTLASVMPGTSEQQLQGLLTTMQWDADAPE